MSLVKYAVHDSIDMTKRIEQLRQRAPASDLLTVAWHELAIATERLTFWLGEADLAWDQTRPEPVDDIVRDPFSGAERM